MVFWTYTIWDFFQKMLPALKFTKLGFRIIGRREKIAEMNGVWRDVILLEKKNS